MEEIVEICNRYDINNFTIFEDGSIDVDGNVNLYDKGIIRLPLNFRNIYGNFYCSCNQLTSLEGAPKFIKGNFYCDSNQLTSFQGAPKEINGNFYCRYNKLTSFEYAPKTIRGEFGCECNNIKSFEYAPNYVGSFNCELNPIYEVWMLFQEWHRVELLNDFDIFRDEDADIPSIFINRLNDFLEMIGENRVENVLGYFSI